MDILKSQSVLKSANLRQLEKKKNKALNLILIKWEFLWRQRSAAVVATSLFHVMKLYYI